MTAEKWYTGKGLKPEFEKPFYDGLHKYIGTENLTLLVSLQPHAIVLFSSDTEFVPAIRLVAEQGVHVVIVGFKTGPSPLNKRLINESYLSLDLGELLEYMEKVSDNQANTADEKSRAAD